MLRIILRKMLKTRWMVLCLLIGVVIAASMLSSIPQYTGGVLQKLLTKDLESVQTKQNTFPGTYYIKYELQTSDSNTGNQQYQSTDSMVSGYISKIGIPILSKAATISNDFYSIVPESGKSVNINILAMKEIEKHIKMAYGRYPTGQKHGDAYEVMISTNAMRNLKLNPGGTYQLTNIVKNDSPGIRVYVAGVFDAKDKTDAFWYDNYSSYSGDLFFDYSTFQNSVCKIKGNQIRICQWYTAFDYHKISLDNIAGIYSSLKAQNDNLSGNYMANVQIPALDTLKLYAGRQKQLNTLMWAIYVPIVIMLIFYLFMVAQLVIDEEKNEIAVLKSRGASRLQIIRSYFFESLIMGAFALIFGPLLGLLLSSMIGASNGFLEFVQRTSLPIRLTSSSYLYALMAVGVFILTMLSPAYFASGTTIVLYKQRHSQRSKPFWKKFYLDVLLLAVSCYGIYNYHIKSNLISKASSTDFSIDPLLLINSSLFILGAGLFFLRIFPLIVSLIFHLGKKFWKPSAYASLLYVSRSGGMNQFLIIFLIFTISLGIFNATAARTINSNTEEQIKYSVGADITIMPDWLSSGGNSDSSGRPSSDSSSSGTAGYIEPDFTAYQHLSGVTSAAKVFKTNEVVVALQNSSDQQSISDTGNTTLYQAYTSPLITYMGINPYEFGKTAYFKAGLLPYHWYNYLNLLTQHQQGFLLSRAFQKQAGVKLGDQITVTFKGIGNLTGVVYAFLDYWPTINPNQIVDGTKQPFFIVGNLDYYLNYLPLQPYQIWIRKAAGVTSKQIYTDIQKKQLSVSSMDDMSQDIIKSKNGPVLEGINGAFTLSFLVTMAIAAAGFLIFWIMSIRSRTLQFGILRAMGVTFKELIKMLALEQALISLVSILVGVAIGYLTSYIFVPMFQISFNAVNQAIPFEAVASMSDYLKIFFIMIVIFACALAVLSAMISKIKIDQALKLGED